MLSNPFARFVAQAQFATGSMHPDYHDNDFEIVFIQATQEKGMDKPIEILLSKTGRNLYIFFGGLLSGIGVPVFEFFNASKIIDEHKIYIRDFRQCWYQDGLPSISEDIYSTAQYIKNHIEAIQPKRIYFVGNSMGGYGAILFSSIIDMGEVIAFSPQTFISPYLRLFHRDMRWSRQILRSYKRSLLKRKVWNLRPLLRRLNQGRKISVFVSKTDRLDLIHAMHIADIQGVNICKFDGGGHEVVKVLRDQGLLPAIMKGTYP